MKWAWKRLKRNNKHCLYEQSHKRPVCILHGIWFNTEETKLGARPVAVAACLDSAAVCWYRCTVSVVHGEQMALPLTSPCVFLSPSWTTAWGSPYLVKLGGGERNTLKARLCGDAIRQTAVGPRTASPHPTHPAHQPTLPFSLSLDTYRDAYSAFRHKRWALGARTMISHSVPPFPQSQITSVIKHLPKPKGLIANFPP